MECVGFLFCFFPLTVHILLCLLTAAADLSPGGRPGGKGFGQRAVLQALKECQPADTCCRVIQDHPVFGRQSYLGEMLGSTAHPRAGSQYTGSVLSLAPPPWSQALQEVNPPLGKVRRGPHWSCSLVLEERIPFVCSLY